MRAFVIASSEDEALKKCSWACIAVATEGGYMCFEYMHDFEEWEKQQ